MMLSRIADRCSGWRATWSAPRTPRASSTSTTTCCSSSRSRRTGCAGTRSSASAGEHERFFELYGDATPQTVFEFLGFREDNPNSIVGCMAQVRENARTIRDRISREMWEDVNGFYHRIRGFRARIGAARAGPHRFCDEVKFASHSFQGVADDTLPHDEGWHFLQAGRALERAEKTARIVDVRVPHAARGPDASTSPTTTSGWRCSSRWRPTRSTGASYHSRIDPRKVAELLILAPAAIRDRSASTSPSCRRRCGRSAGGARHLRQRGGAADRQAARDACTTTASRTSSRAACTSSCADVQRTCRAIGEQIARKLLLLRRA